jgi:hypothetical protein
MWYLVSGRWLTGCLFSGNWHQASEIRYQVAGIFDYPSIYSFGSEVKYVHAKNAAAGGNCNRNSKRWQLPYREAVALGLEERID